MGRPPGQNAGGPAPALASGPIVRARAVPRAVRGCCRSGVLSPSGTRQATGRRACRQENSCQAASRSPWSPATSPQGPELPPVSSVPMAGETRQLHTTRARTLRAGTPGPGLCPPTCLTPSRLSGPDKLRTALTPLVTCDHSPRTVRNRSPEIRRTCGVALTSRPGRGRCEPGGDQ